MVLIWVDSEGYSPRSFPGLGILSDYGLVLAESMSGASSASAQATLLIIIGAGSSS
jgi:hypothetical protein